MVADWEDLDEANPEKEAVGIAIDGAVKLLDEAYNKLSSAVDAESDLYDRVMSMCMDIEDLGDKLKAERGNL